MNGKKGDKSLISWKMKAHHHALQGMINSNSVIHSRCRISCYVLDKLKLITQLLYQLKIS